MKPTWEQAFARQFLCVPTEGAPIEYPSQEVAVRFLKTGDARGGDQIAAKGKGGKGKGGKGKGGKC